MNYGPALPPAETVYRTAKPAHVPPGARLPDWRAFAPSDEEKADAVRLARPVGVSAWDARRTTSAQARAFARDPATALVLALRVEDVLAVGATCGDRMRVVEDPGTTPDRHAPGAAGHAAILGLERLSGQPKAGWKRDLDAIAQRAVAA